GEDLFDLAPVDLAIEPHADPTTVPDVRRHIETVGLFVDQLLLHTGWRGADQTQGSVAVMVVPDRRERLLLPDEPGRRAVAQPLADLRKRNANAPNFGHRVTRAHATFWPPATCGQTVG